MRPGAVPSNGVARPQARFLRATPSLGNCPRSLPSAAESGEDEITPLATRCRSPVVRRAGSCGPLASADSRAYTELYGSVCERATRCLLRRHLGCHPTWRSGAARAWRRFDHGSGPSLPHDPHWHEEARRRPGAGRARHHGEGREGTDVPARPAPTRTRDGVDRAAPPLWDSRFAELDSVLEELKRKEKVNGRNNNK